MQIVTQARVEPMGSVIPPVVGALAVPAGLVRLAASVPPVTMVHLVNVCGCDMWACNVSMYFLCFPSFGKISQALFFSI